MQQFPCYISEVINSKATVRSYSLVAISGLQGFHPIIIELCSVLIMPNYSRYYAGILASSILPSQLCSSFGAYYALNFCRLTCDNLLGNLHLMIALFWLLTFLCRQATSIYTGLYCSLKVRKALCTQSLDYLISSLTLLC